MLLWGLVKSSRNAELDHKNTWAVLAYGSVTAVSAEKSPVHLILMTTLRTSGNFPHFTDLKTNPRGSTVENNLPKSADE